MTQTPDQSTVAGWTSEGQPVPLNDVIAGAHDMRDLLALKLVTGRCAGRLVAQLAGHFCRIPEPFGGHSLLVDVHAVADQIGVMEGAPFSRTVPTKPESQFTTGPLRGLWHKHWFQAGFMIENLALESERDGIKLLHMALRDRLGPGYLDGRPIGEREVGAIAHAAVFDALEHRAGARRAGTRSRVTGEWIVFARQGGRNTYLTLGRHAESNEVILARCRACLPEFPDLASDEPFRSGT